MSAITKQFQNEAEMVGRFCADLANSHTGKKWTIYHETGDFDLLLVESGTGIQVGIEAKLALNLKVLTQALPRYIWQEDGPDYRGVLVPRGKVQGCLSELAPRLGIGIIGYEPAGRFGYFSPNLPDENLEYSNASQWYPWLPLRRCLLPDYVPDVTGGHSAPIKLTAWKIRAIKLCILLDRLGYVTRGDMKSLGISPSYWTQPGGYLTPENGRYVRCSRTPDFRAQHPRSYAEIEVDFPKWGAAWVACRAAAAVITARISEPAQ